jgi:hypothetical protein
LSVKKGRHFAWLWTNNMAASLTRTYKYPLKVRLAMSARWKRLIAENPQWAAASSARMKRLNANPEFAAKNAAAASERMKRRHADLEWAAVMRDIARENMTRLNADPKFAAKRDAASSARTKQAKRNALS